MCVRRSLHDEQPKKIKVYIDDLIELNTEFGNNVKSDISAESTYEYILDIVQCRQKRLFPDNTPILFKVSWPLHDKYCIKLRVASTDSIKCAAQNLAKASAKYFVHNPLHWKTACAFGNHHRTYGDKFVSRA